jgi:hypothetical protein
MVTLNTSDTRQAYCAYATSAQVHNTQCPSTSDRINRFGQVPAHPALVRTVQSSGNDRGTAELLNLLTTLVTTLKGWMNEGSLPPTPQPPVAVMPKPFMPRPPVDIAPAPDATQFSKNLWKEQLAPFMNRPGLASSRNAFDTELIDMFSDKNSELSNRFLSEKARGQKPDDIRNGLRATYESFPYHGATGREEHVAAIKVAMAAFGQSPTGVFTQVVRSGDGYNVTMKDGFKLHITGEELQLAAKAAKFSGSDEGMVKDAQFLFGVMSKRQHLEQARNNATDPFYSLYGKDSAYHAHRTYPGVLAAAGQGIGGGMALSYLGLKEHMQIIDASALGARVGVPVDKGERHKNGVLADGVMEGQLYNQPVSPSLKVVTLRAY